MNKDLLILGAGQYGMVAKEIAEAMNCFQKIDFLDDVNPIAIGRLCDYDRLVKDYKHAIIAIGNAKVRLEWLKKLETAQYDIMCLIHPKAYVSPSCRIAEGCIVEPMAVINTGALLERGVIASAGCVVNHNSVVKEVCHLDCGCVIESDVIVPAMTKVHSNEVCRKISL